MDLPQQTGHAFDFSHEPDTGSGVVRAFTVKFVNNREAYEKA